MVHRSFWIERIEAAWRRRPIVWVSGVRRSGKTCLCQSLDGVEYLDCEMPRVRRRLADPEGFLGSIGEGRVALDEVPRLREPAHLLKIAADHFPKIRIAATGSSTLQASARFRDTLTGRKIDIWLTPMVERDLVEFGCGGLEKRLLQGGLPPFALSEGVHPADYQEWADSYWARDIQELFRLERRAAFQRLLELILVTSGGLFEASRLAGPCGISHTTVRNYLDALAATHVAHVIRPFSGRKTTEIVSMPKVYGFDTGFVAHYRGWDDPHDQDLGVLWEHYVLNELHGQLQGSVLKVHHWRDKRGHEVDFVLVRRDAPAAAIECKWSADSFEPAGLRAFRQIHPATSSEPSNWVVCHDVNEPFRRAFGDLEVHFVGIDQLARFGDDLGHRGDGMVVDRRLDSRQ